MTDHPSSSSGVGGVAASLFHETGARVIAGSDSLTTLRRIDG